LNKPTNQISFISALRKWLRKQRIIPAVSEQPEESLEQANGDCYPAEQEPASQGD
jgi:hypothetical protein